MWVYFYGSVCLRRWKKINRAITRVFTASTSIIALIWSNTRRDNDLATSWSVKPKWEKREIEIGNLCFEFAKRVTHSSTSRSAKCSAKRPYKLTRYDETRRVTVAHFDGNDDRSRLLYRAVDAQFYANPLEPFAQLNVTLGRNKRLVISR